jgi:hypothetical protein
LIGDTNNKETSNLNQVNNDDKVIFVREIKKITEAVSDGKEHTYVVYRADSAQIAKDFLERYPVGEETNIIIETPEGNFGKSKDGIYKEQDG